MSVLLVVAYWATSTWATLLRPGGAALPGSVRAIAVYVCIKTALALAVVWTLLRATEEHLASLGFTVSRTLIFLKRRRAADSMVVHALFDLFGVALAYFLYAGRH